MRLYLDTYTRLFYSSANAQVPTISVSVKRRDLERIEVIFWDERQVVNLPEGATGEIGLKRLNDFEGDYLAFADGWAVAGTGQSRKYTFSLNLNTLELEAEFTPGVSQVEAMLEISWTTSAGTLFSSTTLPCRVFNDVIRGNEGTPATLPLFYTSTTSDFKASQAEAELGTDNTKWMSPLRTAQAIATIPPSSHLHTTSQITDFATAVAAARPLATQAEAVAGTDNTKMMTPLRTAQAIQGGQIDNPTFSGELQVKGDTPVVRVEINPLTEWTQLENWGVQSGWGNGRLSFEERILAADDLTVLDFSTAGQLSIGTRTLKSLGAPVDPTDAVRKVDLDALIARVVALENA